MSLQPEKPNFIQAALCDNDFGWDLRKGLAEGVSEYAYHLTLCPILWKKFLIAFVVGQQLKGRIDISTDQDLDWENAHQVEKYLRDQLRVTFERKAPTEENNGGSACIDLNTGEAWTY